MPNENTDTVLQAKRIRSIGSAYMEHAQEEGLKSAILNIKRIRNSLEELMEMASPTEQFYVVALLESVDKTIVSLLLVTADTS